MPRPAVDIVVPFVGSDAALAALTEEFGVLVAAGDTLTVVDNRATSSPEPRPSGVATVVGAPAQQSSYFARNRGAERGQNPWIVFLDADVDPDPDLIGRYFEQPPAGRAAILVGGIVDAPPKGERTTAVEHYARVRGAVGHETTLRAENRFSFAQTANVAMRREAFEAVGGFTEGIRSGGDADICFRIKDAGWTMEPRFEARVEHQNRTSVRKFARVYARYGSGAAWVDRHHPGYSPRPNPLRVLVSLGASVVRTALALARGRVGDAQAYALDGVQHVAITVGRLASNDVKGIE